VSTVPDWRIPWLASQLEATGVRHRALPKTKKEFRSLHLAYMVGLFQGRLAKRVARSAGSLADAAFSLGTRTGSERPGRRLKRGT
jgi:hypothetical protein